MKTKQIFSLLRGSLFVVPLALLVTGCSLWGDSVTTEEQPTGMTVTVNLRDEHRCSRISPEIIVSNIPKGTANYDVRLVEYGKGDDDEIYLGGGFWPEDGTGVIPEGVLARHYRGPCPPAGQSRKYAFIISAMGKDNQQPLSVRIYRFEKE